MVPISLFSDSYKASHYLQYPDCQQMVAVRTCPIYSCQFLCQLHVSPQVFWQATGSQQHLLSCANMPDHLSRARQRARIHASLCNHADKASEAACPHSTASSARVLRRTQGTRGWCFTACGTSSRTSSRDSGPSVMWMRLRCFSSARPNVCSPGQSAITHYDAAVRRHPTRPQLLMRSVCAMVHAHMSRVGTRRLS